MILLGVLAAQAPPAPAWSPADEAGLIAWYRVEDLSLSDGDSLTTWADQSGNSHTLTAAATAPKFKSAITPGGAPVVRFAGGSSTEYLATSSFSPDTTCSMFLFGSCAGVAATRVLAYHGSPGVRGWGIVQNSSNTFVGHFGGVTTFGSVGASTNFRNYGLLVNSGTDPDGTFLVDNANAATTNSAPGTSGWGNGLVIGKHPDAAVPSPDLDLCEFVYFDHVLDSTARAALQSYFEDKYL